MNILIQNYHFEIVIKPYQRLIHNKLKTILGFGSFLDQFINPRFSSIFYQFSALKFDCTFYFQHSLTCFIFGFSSVSTTVLSHATSKKESASWRSDCRKGRLKQTL